MRVDLSVAPYSQVVLVALVDDNGVPVESGTTTKSLLRAVYATGASLSIQLAPPVPPVDEPPVDPEPAP